MDRGATTGRHSKNICRPLRALVLAGVCGADCGLSELELLLHIADDRATLQAAKAAHEELRPHLACPRHCACSQAPAFNQNHCGENAVALKRTVELVPAENHR